MRSRTEQNFYDFKIGTVTCGETKINTDGSDKILKTLTAINNIGPQKVGYIIVGIADKEESANNCGDLVKKRVNSLSLLLAEKGFSAARNCARESVILAALKKNRNYKENRHYDQSDT